MNILQRSPLNLMRRGNGDSRRKAWRVPELWQQQRVKELAASRLGHLSTLLAVQLHVSSIVVHCTKLASRKIDGYNRESSQYFIVLLQDNTSNVSGRQNHMLQYFFRASGVACV
jgi:hypothetical protein